MPSGKRIDWPKYDKLFYDELPKYSIREFASKFLSHISEKAVGVHAKKLGIKHKKHSPTQQHRQAISKKISKENQSIINFIKQHRDDFSNEELATKTNISTALLCRLIKKHNINLSDAGKERARRSSIEKQRNKIPWNKGKKMSLDFRIKCAKSRQRQSGKLSQIQATFYRIVEDLGIKHHKENEPECRFGPWTFDGRIVDGVDFLVEVQGGYTHNLPKNKVKDEAKATYMRRYFPHIPIRYIWEHEFGAANRVKFQLLKWLGRTEINTIDFNFNDVIIKSIDHSIAREFISAFHYLEKLVGKICIGAFLHNKLIAVSVWGTPTRAEIATRLNLKIRECLELRRFTIHDAYHKKNLASWFLSKSEKMLPQVKMLVSFSDSAVGHDGIMYKASGWTYDGDTSSSYFYVDEDGYVMLKKTLYNQANKLHLTESDFAETYNYKKVYSPPKRRYLKQQQK